MSKPWYDMAAGKLDPVDRIQKTYSCSFDKNRGYLCISNFKILFVSEKGFLRKSYDVLFDIPFADLKEVRLDRRYKLNIVSKDKEHVIETSDISAKTLLNAIKGIVEESPSKPKVVFPAQ